MEQQYTDYRIGFELAIQHGKVIGLNRLESLQNFVNTDTFFKTLFRKDHPFLSYTVREKNNNLEYRIDALLLPQYQPMFCSIPLLTELGINRADIVTERIKSRFYDYVKNYLIDIVHADTEKERDALELVLDGKPRYSRILAYWELITQNISFLKTSFYDGADEIALLLETRGHFSMIEPIELSFDKYQLAETVTKCPLGKKNPSDELKKYFNQQITAHLHRAKAIAQAPAVLPSQVSKRHLGAILV